MCRENYSGPWVFEWLDMGALSRYTLDGGWVMLLRGMLSVSFGRLPEAACWLDFTVDEASKTTIRNKKRSSLGWGYNAQPLDRPNLGRYLKMEKNGRDGLKTIGII